VSIAVADTGRGMSPADVEAAFDLFSRGGSALGAAAEGAGIGLSIVKRLVELHGGSVGIQSGLGVGTTVTFTLPNAPEAASRSNELVG
jgi:two-component system sensor histidine kinase ChiS